MNPTVSPSLQLADLVSQNTDELLKSWRLIVRQLEVARHLETPVLNDHMIDLLGEIVLELKRDCADTLIEAGGPAALHENPVVHGLERLSLGFNLEEVVAEYNALRSAVINLAEGHSINVTGTPGHTLHRVIDGAVGIAVQTFSRQQAERTRKQRDQHLAFVVHDLRSPLSAVSLAANLLGRQITGEDETNLVDVIKRNVRKLEALIDRVLREDEAIRAEDEQQIGAEWVNLHELVSRLIEELKPLAERDKIELCLEMDEALTAYVDAGRAELIFQNLVSNAIRYTAKGRVSVSGKRIEGAVQCSVADNGIGIPHEKLGKIFQAGEGDHLAGFGLGLSIVKRLVEAHRGQVVVFSEEGKGTRFTFDFPNPST